MRTTHALHATAIMMAIVGSLALQAQEQMSRIGQSPAASVAECAQAQARADRTIDAANRRLEAARQSNSPTAMRATVDEMQAALRQLRAEIAPCASPQAAASPAGPREGHVMPNAQQAPSAMPGTPIMRPGSTVPAPAAVAPAAPAPGGAADPHGGHVMPGAPAVPAAAPRAAPSSAAPRTTKPAPPASSDPHAGHTMPGAAAPAGATSSAPALTTAANPVTDPANLMCATKVDPKKAPNVTYRGRTYYFCLEKDRAEFAKDPARYFRTPAK